MVEVGDKAPGFTLPDQTERKVSLRDHAGSWVILYFYPKDNTAGCSAEATDFSNSLDAFQKVGATVLGVSPDSVESHSRFTEKLNLAITLLSDPEHKVLSNYGAWGTKKLYGREVEGVRRSTVLIDPSGRIAHVWPKVRVKDHVDAVKAKLADLQEQGEKT